MYLLDSKHLGFSKVQFLNANPRALFVKSLGPESRYSGRTGYSSSITSRSVVFASPDGWSSNKNFVFPGTSLWIGLAARKIPG